MTSTPIYVAHPSNFDAEEDFAILFTGPKDGPVFDPIEAEKFFGDSALRIARLLAAKCNRDWREAFTAAWKDAVWEVDDYFDSANDEDATVEAFVGQMPEVLVGRVTQSTNIELAS